MNRLRALPFSVALAALLLSGCPKAFPDDEVATPQSDGSAGVGGEAGDASADVGGSGGAAGDAAAEDSPAADAGDGGGAIGTIGTACAPPNALACAGHAQKLVLYCDPSTGKWTALQSCSGQQFCDTRPGASQGSCQDPVALCVGRAPGDRVCDGTTSVECGPDLVTSTETPCQYVCAAGACGGSCSPGSRECNGATPQACDSAGAWNSEAPCPYACTGDGQCTGVCVPSSHQCNGLVPESCDATGQWVDGTPCANVCDAGACGGACAPAATQCNGLVPQTCDASGNWQDGAPCPYVCQGGGCTGVCSPGSKQCSGNVPQTCDANGAWKSGTACPSACSGGQCVSACTDGTKQCTGLVPQTCVSGAWQSGSACPYICAAGACAGSCSPGAQQCSGDVPQTCDASGAWKSGTACPYLCTGGVCTGACTPNNTRCSGQTAQTCDASGQWQDSASCPYLCTNGTCTGSCAPGSKQCSATVPQTCDASGAWQSGALCAFVCATGSCTGVCTPGATQCSGLTPQTCDTSGQWQSGAPCAFVCAGGTCSGACSPGAKQCSGQVPQTCDTSGAWQSGAACPNVCTAGQCAGSCSPGSKQCNGNIPQTCDGSGAWQNGTACAYVCSNGSCAGACIPGTKQCSGLVPQTCDASGAWQGATPCNATNGTASCAAGVCSIACSSGYGDCDANAATGCETALNSTTNCGACGSACSPANGTGTCTSGICIVSTCAAGWGNCDGSAANGCETSLKSATNCGACGTTCSRANASSSCASGVCQLGTCTAGWGNCDGSDANGCETYLNGDPNHCGNCATVCSGATPACSAGACVASTSAPLLACSAPPAGQAAGCYSMDPAAVPPPAKPYFMIVLDNSGSMTTSIATGSNSCGYTHNRIGDARCVVQKIVQTYGDRVDFGLSTYATKEACPGSLCYNGCGASYAPADNNYCGPLTVEPTLTVGADGGTVNVHAGGYVVVPIAQDAFWAPPVGPTNTASILSLVDNDCSNGEIGASSNTPLGGTLFELNRYLAGTYVDPFTSQAIPSPLGPASYGGHSAELTCRPINVVFITDGDETCDATVSPTPLSGGCRSGQGAYPNSSGERLASYEADLLWKSGVTVDGQTFHVKTYVVGFVGATTAALDHIAACGGTAASYTASDDATLTTALTSIIGPSVNGAGAAETCDGADNNCDGCVDEPHVPPSCRTSAPGTTDCGDGGSGTESCCASLAVTGGTFYRSYDGISSGYTSTAYPATISSFRLDKFEITVGRFRQFVAAWDGGWRPAQGAGRHTHLNGGSGLVATGGGYETGWDAGNWNGLIATNIGTWSDTSHLSCDSTYQTWTASAASNENRPINCVTWHEAYAFCIWDGGFLPSDAEWNFAAAGGAEQRAYPWSIAYPPGSTAIACSDANYYPCVGATNNVGTEATPGRCKYGQADLAGNVWEWDLDWYASYGASCTDCAYLSNAAGRVVRGGSFSNGASNQLVSGRNYDPPTGRLSGLGARCARTL